MSYEDLIALKSASAASSGLVVPDADIADHLFPHQRDLTKWALRRGKAAIFANTGLGKGPMALEWARHVSARGRVLILAPLAVGPQLAREATRFGVTAEYARSDGGQRIVITNYEMRHAFDATAFAGIVLDESSILKSFDGKTRTDLITSFRDTPYKLACTATPAPNDFTELGNHSEFLGIKSRSEMLSEFFVHDGGSTQDWHLKGHAVVPFWRWVATWGAVVNLPSDLGHDDGPFLLPPLRMVEHVVPATTHDIAASGQLFALDARTLTEQRAARRGTIESRSARVAELARRHAWLGSQNTRPHAEPEWRQTQSTQHASALGDPEHQRKIGNTCETTTRAIRSSGSGHESSKTRSTNGSGRSTRRTTRSASTTSARPGCGSEPTQIGSEISISANSTELASRTTNGCSPNKVERAPSAEVTTMQADAVSTSTIATQPTPSADCCVDDVTLGLVSSTTTPNDLGAPSNICNSVVIWCELNDEQNAIAAHLGDLCVSIQGSDTDDDKISRHERWLRGDVPVLVAKASQFGYGLNWQHCHRVIFAGPSNSYERTYQAIRRCWRFGQKHEVTVDVVRSDLDGAIVENYRRKEIDAAKMAAEMSAHVGAVVRAEVRGLSREFDEYRPTMAMTIPRWL